MPKKRSSKPQKGSSSTLERHRRWWDAATIVGCLIVLAALWLWPWLTAQNQWRIWYVKEGALATLLQVVPATIAAVFIFAAGAVFIMVQIIGPTLGSRAIEALLVTRRARACVIAGIILLVACLALAALALIKEKEPPTPSEAAAGSALALASLVYVPLSIWCISSVFHDFVSPGAYSRLLSRWGVRRGRVAADWVFHQLRALRQWLRTACGTGESRDIVFALEGFQNLLGRYCDKARAGKEKSLNEKLREDNPPSEYFRTGGIVNSRLRQQLLDRNSDPPDKISQKGWFGDEFGRALARCAEVGIQSGALLRRDLDRLLVVLGGATLQLADLEPTPEKDHRLFGRALARCAEVGIWSGALLRRGLDRLLVVLGGASLQPPDVEPPPEKDHRILGEEAGFLLDRIAEIGMYAFTFQNKTYGDWFVRPALVLASLEAKLEKVDAQVTGPAGQKHSLAGRSLAAWCLVNYTFQRSKEGANPKGKISAQGGNWLGMQARTRLQLWDEAKRLATGPAMRPSWMPLVDDDRDNKERLNAFIDGLQVLVAAQPEPENVAVQLEPKNLELADLDHWIIGADVHGEPAAAHPRGYTATAKDGVATVCSITERPNREAFLGQVLAADHYRGTTVTFGGEMRAEGVTGHAELGLHIFPCDRSQSVRKASPAISSDQDWKWHEVTASVPDEAEFIQFSLTLTGTGRVALSNVVLTSTQWRRPAFLSGSADATGHR